MDNKKIYRPLPDYLTIKESSIEGLLWTPENQENKTSQYGGINIRYKYNLKRQYIKQWYALHTKIIP